MSHLRSFRPLRTPQAGHARAGPPVQVHELATSRRRARARHGRDAPLLRAWPDLRSTPGSVWVRVRAWMWDGGCMYTHICAHTHARAQTDRQTDAHTHTHTHTHTHIHTHTHTCIDAQMYTHTQVMMLNEGWDCPAVDMVVLARATDSEIVFTQQMGRGLRRDTSDPDKVHTHTRTHARTHARTHTHTHTHA